MDQINCLIVDDEPLARELMVTYCSHLPFLNVAGVCKNALEAKTVLHQQHIDILFLDIHLPVLDGMSFLKTIKVMPQVILTTAYKEYAANAFDLAVCDYLVKPFSLDRFIIAVDKATERLGKTGSARVVGSVHPNDGFFIKTDGKIYRVDYQNILFAEANGNYIKIITTSGTITPVMSFSNLEKILPGDNFIKVHRSFMINSTKIDRIEGNRVFIRSYEIPVGKNYKLAFFDKLGL